MATGESHHSLAFHFRMGVSTVCGIIEETARVTWECLKEKYMPVPSRDLIIKMNLNFGTSGTLQIALAVWMENMFGYVTLITLVPCTTITNSISQLCYKDWQMLIANPLQLMLVPTVDRVMGVYLEIQV